MALEQSEAAGGDRTWNPPPGFYGRYLAFMWDSLQGMLSVISDEHNKEHLKASYKPESEDDILRRLRSIPPENRDRSVEVYMMGYEAAKRHPRIQDLVQRVVSRVQEAHRKNISE